MKLYLALYLLILESLSETSKITKSENTLNNTSKAISCYSCTQTINFNIDDLYNIKPRYLKNNNFCINNKNNTTTRIRQANHLCSIFIDPPKEIKYKAPGINKYKMFIHFTQSKVNVCSSTKALTNDIICLKSNCVSLYKCCDGHLCNNVEAFKLISLALYSNYQGKNLNNNYSQYTNKTCSISVKDKNPIKIQPCIAIDSKYIKNNISSVVKTTAHTTNNNYTPVHTTNNNYTPAHTINNNYTPVHTTNNNYTSAHTINNNYTSTVLNYSKNLSSYITYTTKNFTTTKPIFYLIRNKKTRPPCNLAIKTYNIENILFTVIIVLIYK
jgi:hypothetical protein